MSMSAGGLHPLQAPNVCGCGHAITLHNDALPLCSACNNAHTFMPYLQISSPKNSDDVPGFCTNGTVFPTVASTLRLAIAANATTIGLASTAGINPGFALFLEDNTTTQECVRVTAVTSINTISVSAVQSAHPVNTPVQAYPAFNMGGPGRPANGQRAG